MQLNRNLRRALAAASGALLATGPAQAADLVPGEPAEWTVDSALLYYKEADRVTAIEPVVLLRWDRGDDEALSFKLTFDSLTGASANGAAPASTPQTFTSPSGGSTYTIAPGQTPLDPTFKDARGALNVTWELPYGRFTRVSYGLNLSAEYDYQSMALSATLARDFNLKNTTVAFGVSLGNDKVTPVGGTPVPLTSLPTLPWVCEEDDVLSCPGLGPEPARLAHNQEKTLGDVLIGVTQVLSPSALLQLNYSWGNADGYMTDPYKNLSVVDGAPGPNQGNPVDHLYEQRPDSRTKQSLYAQYRRQNDGGDTWDVALRHMWDDWGVVSETADLHYRWQLGDRDFLRPHLRYYVQGAADFYTPYLVSGAPLPAYASADYRLGDMTATTIGIEYGHLLSGGSEFDVHLEVYSQSGDPPPGAIGVLAGYDLFPTVTATMVQFDYTF